MMPQRGYISLVPLVIVAGVMLIAGVVLYQKGSLRPSDTASQFRSAVAGQTATPSSFGGFATSADRVDKEFDKETQAIDEQLKALDSESLDVDQWLNE